MEDFDIEEYKPQILNKKLNELSAPQLRGLFKAAKSNGGIRKFLSEALSGNGLFQLLEANESLRKSVLSDLFKLAVIDKEFQKKLLEELLVSHDAVRLVLNLNPIYLDHIINMTHDDPVLRLSLFKELSDAKNLMQILLRFPQYLSTMLSLSSNDPVWQMSLYTELSVRYAFNNYLDIVPELKTFKEKMEAYLKLQAKIEKSPMDEVFARLEARCDEIIDRCEDIASPDNLNDHLAESKKESKASELYAHGNTFFSKAKENSLFQWYDFEKAVMFNEKVAVLD